MCGAWYYGNEHIIMSVRLFASCLERNIFRRKTNYVNAGLPLFLLEPHHLIIFSVSAATKMSLKWTDIPGSPRSAQWKQKSGFLHCGNHSYCSLGLFPQKSKFFIGLQSIPLLCEPTEQPPYCSSCMAESYLQVSLLSDTYIHRHIYMLFRSLAA